MHDDTRVVRSGRHPESFHGAVNPPVYHVSTILSETVEELEERGRTTEIARTLPMDEKAILHHGLWRMLSLSWRGVRMSHFSLRYRSCWQCTSGLSERR